LETLSSIGLAGAFIGGLISFFSPCTLPLLPAYLSVVTGGSAGKAERRLEALTLSAFFVFGFSVVFILLGLGASSIGQLMRGYRQEFNWIAGSAVILLGLFMTGLFRLGYVGIFCCWSLPIAMRNHASSVGLAVSNNRRHAK